MIAVSPQEDTPLRRAPDWADRLCINWAEQRRKALGIVLPEKFTLQEVLGKMNCTLGSVKEEGEGASYNGNSQNWPEVYTGDALLVHRCWSGMPRPWAEVMHVHYVWRELPVKVRVQSLGLNLTEYYARLNLLKPHVDNYVNGVEKTTKSFKIQWVRYNFTPLSVTN
jgi:hypothetical protein